MELAKIDRLIASAFPTWRTRSPCRTSSTDPVATPAVRSIALMASRQRRWRRGYGGLVKSARGRRLAHDRRRRARDCGDAKTGAIRRPVHMGGRQRELPGAVGGFSARAGGARDVFSTAPIFFERRLARAPRARGLGTLCQLCPKDTGRKCLETCARWRDPNVLRCRHARSMCAQAVVRSPRRTPDRRTAETTTGRAR